MPLVNVMVSARAYTIACDEGEEAHLKELAAHVDQKVRELTGSVGQVGDQKLLLMAAVLITDEFFEARGKLEGHAKRVGDLSTAQAELDARIVAADMRASDMITSAEARAARAVEEAEERAARAVEVAEKRAAEVEEHAAQSIEIDEKRAADAESRANAVREEAEAQIAQARRDADACIAQAMSATEGKGDGASAETEELAAMEMDEAAARVERIVERLKAA